MIELFVAVASFVCGFAARPYYERWRFEQAAEKAKAASREKRSASAKEAAQKRKIRAGEPQAAPDPLRNATPSLNGSSYQPRDTEQQS